MVELRDLGSQEDAQDGYRRRLTYNLWGLAGALWLFVVIAAAKGIFSAGLLLLALVLTGGAAICGTGRRLGSTWMSLAGAMSLIGLVLIGVFDIV
ncbi:hypothetical protein AN219_14515 [Streptomyces nanshensis]|nr:hypothetical protein AN219_14515 [Streptomyces nanshensis]